MIRNRCAVVMLALLAALPAATAGAQSFDARSMAMGGVQLPGGGAWGSVGNVAYRGVPQGSSGSTSIPLPLGLIPVLADPPQLDPNKSDFNAFELANLLSNIPWNLSLFKPKTPSNDISVSIGQNQLSVDLGDLADIFPKDRSRFAGVVSGPAPTYGFRGAFVGLQPLVHYDNTLRFNAALRGVLVDGADVLTNTDYVAYDNVVAQAAGGVQFGWAGPLVKHGDDPHDAANSGLYVGARVKLLRGFAYGSADNIATLTTTDSLFGSNPVNLRYYGSLREAHPRDGRWGEGVDLGMVWFRRGIEFGVGINDISTRLRWKVKESIAYTDTVTDEIVQKTLRDSVDFTSKVPTTYTANAATHVGRWLLAVDIQRGVRSTTAHVGGETGWRGMMVRAGAGLDADQLLQVAGGVGLRFGPVGLDLALATQSRNLSHERGLDLGAGLEFYHREKP